MWGYRGLNHLIYRLARIEDTLTDITYALHTLHRQGDALMATSAENKAALDALTQQIADAAANLAGDIANLASQIGTGMTQADVDAAQASLQAVADKLKDLAAVTPG